MSGLLRFASFSTLSPARVAHRGGPAARSSCGTPSLSLVLSGGVHLAALMLILAAAARSGLEEPRQMEMRILIDPGLTLTPPPSSAPPVGGRAADDERGRIEPAPPERRVVEQPIDRPTFNPGAGGGVRPDNAQGGGIVGEGDLAASPERSAVDPNTPIAYYDEPPVPVEAPEPPYEDMPREAGIEGKVVLEALVTWEGRVREVRIREGNPMLAAPAAKTVKTWRFRPARWQGRAVSCWVSIPIVFRLH